MISLTLTSQSKLKSLQILKSMFQKLFQMIMLQKMKNQKKIQQKKLPLSQLPEEEQGSELLILKISFWEARMLQSEPDQHSELLKTITMCNSDALDEKSTGRLSDV